VPAQRLSRYLPRVRVTCLILLSALAAACTETPSYFPPCVDPASPCAVDDGGADASTEGGGASLDAGIEASDGAGLDVAPAEAASDATASVNDAMAADAGDSP
jgi:hypothetical protein